MTNVPDIARLSERAAAQDGLADRHETGDGVALRGPPPGE